MRSSHSDIHAHKPRKQSGEEHIVIAWQGQSQYLGGLEGNANLDGIGSEEAARVHNYVMNTQCEGLQAASWA